MRTYTEQRIELNQDLGLAWQLVASQASTCDTWCTSTDLGERFEQYFELVRTLNEEKREELRKQLATTTEAPHGPQKEEAKQDLHARA